MKVKQSCVPVAYEKKELRWVYAGGNAVNET